MLRNIGNIIKSRSLDFARYGQPWTQKTVQKRSFSPTHCFYTFLGNLQTFSAEGPIPNAPKRRFFYPRSCSKGPNHALEKVPNQRNTRYVLFSKIFYNGKHFSSEGAQNRHEHVPCWALLLQTMIPRDNYTFIHTKLLQTSGKTMDPNAKGSEPAGHPVYIGYT